MRRGGDERGRAWVPTQAGHVEGMAVPLELDPRAPLELVVPRELDELEAEPRLLELEAAPLPPVLVPVEMAVPRPRVEDTLAVTRRAELRPLVPAALRSRAERRALLRWTVRRCAHTAGYHLLRLPLYAGRALWRAPRGLGRGLWRVGRWVFDCAASPVRAGAIMRADAREYLALERARNDRVKLRLIVFGVAALVAAVAGIWCRFWGPGWVQVGAAAAVLALLGRLGTSPDRPLACRAVVVARARRLTAEAVEAACVAAGLASEREPIEWAAPIMRDGPGWRADFYLPRGRTVGQILRAKANLASGLDVQASMVWPERVRGTRGSERRVSLWVADEDPMALPAGPSPLVRAKRFDFWEPIPLGVNVRGDEVRVPLMWHSLLIGALPRRGKTFTARQLVLAAALDPHVRLYIYDGKGSPDWVAFTAVAYRCGFGLVQEDECDPADALLADMVELKADVEARYVRLRKLPAHLVPEGKLTPELARDPAQKMPVVLVMLDEVQEYLTHPRIGKELLDLLTYLVRVAPAVGVHVVSATQKPDERAVPTQFRDQHALRFALHVSSWQVSDVILGSGAHMEGLDSSVLDAEARGVGVLRGIGGGADGTVRAYYVDGRQAEAILVRARALREAAGTLSGHALDGAAARGPVHNLLGDVLAVLRPGEARVWSELVCERLAALRPQVYDGWEPAQLAAALKPLGVTTVQVWDTTAEGTKANRRGVDRDQLTAALEARTAGTGGTEWRHGAIAP